MGGKQLFEIRDLSIGFTGNAGQTLPVLRNVDFTVSGGETVGIVGESGSGKSTLALAAMGYLKHGLRVLGGSAKFKGRNTFEMTTRELEDIRGGEMAMIPQNSGQSLTPTMRVGKQLREALRLHTDLPESSFQDRMVELLTQVRLPEPENILKRFPHELSGGQQQRVAISMALAGEAEALLLDEPTTGLDVTTQAHILELLRDLASETGTAMVYVSHDLGAIARVSDRVVVMYAGEVVLEGNARNVLLSPTHPYARGLLSSIPSLKDSRLPAALEGRPPAPGAAGNGCSFVDRCAIAQPECRSVRPDLIQTPEGESVRCPFYAKVPDLAATEQTVEMARADGSATDAIRLDRLSIDYAKKSLLDQLLRRNNGSVPTVEEITLKIEKGETVGLVGESGSGKSTILKSIAGLLEPSSGKIQIGEQEPLAEIVDKRPMTHRRQIQLIFQNPDESLNPRHTVEEIIAQPLRLYFNYSAEELRKRSIDLLERVRLSSHYLTRLPSQLSGGEKQRVAIARAFAAEPELILCDEVTSALDVSVQAAVLNLLNQLKRERGTTYIFVSHDLAVVRCLSDRVAVLYQGRLCELGESASVYSLPSHPYTEVLLGAVLEPDPEAVPEILADDVVELSPPERGCPFQRRCPRKVGSICDTETPPWQVGAGSHAIRCHIPLEELYQCQNGGKSADR